MLGTLGTPAFSRAAGPISGFDWSTPTRDSTTPEEAPQPTPTAYRPDDAKIDREWNRFLGCAIPTPNGLGLYDPSESPDMPSGVPIEDWRRFEHDCANLGRRKSVSPKGQVELTV